MVRDLTLKWRNRANAGDFLGGVGNQEYGIRECSKNRCRILRGFGRYW